jgi:hypothetical protein
VESPIDREGSIKKGKNDSQYQGLNPPIKGGDNGSKTKTSTGMPEGSKGKMFKGRS